MQVRTRMVAARQRLRMTQEELAEASGVPQSTVSKTERAEHDPLGSTVAALCRVLNLTPDDLLFAEDIEPKELRSLREIPDEPDDPPAHSDSKPAA